MLLLTLAEGHFVFSRAGRENSIGVAGYVTAERSCTSLNELTRELQHVECIFSNIHQAEAIFHVSQTVMSFFAAAFLRL